MPVEQLSLEVVIVVACVCSTVVLILTVILIVLCCRRHHDYYEKTETYIGNTLDCPVADLTQLKAPSYRSATVKSNNLDITSSTTNAVDQDNQVGIYSCAEHVNVNINVPLPKVQNVDNAVGLHDCRLKPETAPSETIVDGVDGSCVAMTTGDKRQKKIIYEVVV